VHLPFELHLALRYLRFHRGRTFLSAITLISVAGVTTGSAALVIALSLNNGFQADVRERILGGSAHLTVLGTGEETIPAADDLAQRIADLPGVLGAGPVLFSPAMITADGGAPTFAEIHGVDPERHAGVLAPAADDPSPVAALLDRPSPGAEGVVLGESLARRVGARPGDRVRVLVPRVTLTPFAPVPRSRVFVVAATFRSESFDQDSRRAYMRLDDARRLLDAPSRASWVEVRIDDVRRLEVAKRDLRRHLGPAWAVVDLIEQNQAMLKALNTEKVILFLAIGLIVLVASLNIVSTLILMVHDKVKEIGTLTAMGARPGAIATIFVLQGAMIGSVGSALGLALGAGAAWGLDRFRVLPLNPEVYYLAHVPFSPRAGDLGVVAVLSMAASLSATIYPAWKAARQDPVEAIRHG
jgi:lipoprotein-releasing system permease protein